MRGLTQDLPTLDAGVSSPALQQTLPPPPGAKAASLGCACHTAPTVPHRQLLLHAARRVCSARPLAISMWPACGSAYSSAAWGPCRITPRRMTRCGRGALPAEFAGRCYSICSRRPAFPTGMCCALQERLCSTPCTQRFPKAKDATTCSDAFDTWTNVRRWRMRPNDDCQYCLL